MKHSVNPTSKRTSWFMFTLLGITMSLALTLTIIEAAPFRASSRLQVTALFPTYPTDFPPGKQTIEAAQRLTQQAGALTPFPTGTIWYFNSSISTPEPIGPSVGTPAGDGVIEGSGTGSYGPGPYMYELNDWSMQKDGKYTIVWAGLDKIDPDQGMVYVVTSTIDGGY